MTPSARTGELPIKKNNLTAAPFSMAIWLLRNAQTGKYLASAATPEKAPRYPAMFRTHALALKRNAEEGGLFVPVRGRLLIEPKDAR